MQPLKMIVTGAPVASVSKMRASGIVAHWLKIKNPAAPAVTREAEEDWGR